MARKTPEEKIAELVEKEQAIKAKQKEQLNKLKAQLQNEKAKITTANRKKDTRRKIIAGALALEHMEYDEAHAAAMRKLITRHVKPEDKELFADYLNGSTTANDAPSAKSSFAEKLTTAS